MAGMIHHRCGILHDVIEDCVLEAYPHSMLEQRIGEKFGREART
jgi:hypothetical protein